MSWKLPKLNVSDIAVLGMLIAVNFVLSRLTFSSKFLVINFTFIVTALIGQWYGPLWNSIIAALIDIFFTLLSGAGYYPLFTLSAALTAFTYGYFFYHKKVTLKRVIIAQFIITFLVDALLNTIWLVMINHQIPKAFLIARFITEIVAYPIKVFLTYAFCNNQSIQRIKNTINQKRL